MKFCGWVPRRRYHDRLKIEGTVEAVVDQNQKKSFIAKDLSVRGIGLVGNYSFKIGQTIKVIVEKPFFQEAVQKDAKVVWCEELEKNIWRAGLDFGLDNVLEFN